MAAELLLDAMNALRLSPTLLFSFECLLNVPLRSVGSPVFSKAFVFVGFLNFSGFSGIRSFDFPA